MKISVALCTYNGGHYLDQQIRSILLQTMPVNEIIIGDDGSSDETITILAAFVVKYPLLFRVIQNEKKLGSIKNFENVIGLCTGDIIFLSDQDDVWHPYKVSRTIHFFKLNKNVLLLFTNATLIDDNSKKLTGTLWDKWGFTKKMQQSWKNNKNAVNSLLLNDNKVTGATIAFSALLKPKMLPIEASENYWHDAWFALHAAANNGLFFLDEFLVDYRIHSKQQIGITRVLEKKIVPENNFISIDEMRFNIAKQYPSLFKGKSILERIMYRIR